MSPAQKQSLLENQQRLLRLEPGEQQRLRAFAAELEQDPEAARLREVMLRYEAWTQRLPLDIRSELAQLTGDARVARVKQLIGEEARLAALRLSPEDAALVAAWIEHRVMANMPPEQRERLEQATDAERRRMIGRLIWQRSQQSGMAHGFNFRTQDLQALAETLSPEARRQMAQAATAHRGQQLIGEWMRQSLGMNGGSSRGVGISPRGMGGDFRQPSRRGRPRD
jgi:hypothetical protein